MLITINVGMDSCLHSILSKIRSEYGLRKLAISLQRKNSTKFTHLYTYQTKRSKNDKSTLLKFHAIK